MVFYQVLAQVHPAQFGRVIVHTHIFVCRGASLPPPSLVSHYGFHTLRRFFSTIPQARKFAAHLRSNIAVGPAVLPPTYFLWLRSHYSRIHKLSRLSNGQLSLF